MKRFYQTDACTAIRSTSPKSRPLTKTVPTERSFFSYGSDDGQSGTYQFYTSKKKTQDPCSVFNDTLQSSRTDWPVDHCEESSASGCYDEAHEASFSDIARLLQRVEELEIAYNALLTEERHRRHSLEQKYQDEIRFLEEQRTKDVKQEQAIRKAVAQHAKHSTPSAESALISTLQKVFQTSYEGQPHNTRTNQLASDLYDHFRNQSGRNCVICLSRCPSSDVAIDGRCRVCRQSERCRRCNGPSEQVWAPDVYHIPTRRYVMHCPQCMGHCFICDQRVQRSPEQNKDIVSRAARICLTCEAIFMNRKNPFQLSGSKNGSC